MPVVTNQPIAMSYFIRDISAALTTYNRMRWFRSRTGPSGLFEAATAPAPGPAVLTGRRIEPFSLSGRVLSLRINGATTVTISFPGADPTSSGYVISQIAATTSLVSGSVSGGKISLTTALSGSLASIEVLEGDAAPFIGLDTGAAAIGIDPDVVLSSAREYFYVDQNGSHTYFYKSQLRHSTTAVISNQSVPLAGDYFRTVSAVNTITAYLSLADLTGRPIAGRRVHLVNPILQNNLVVGDTRYGVFRHTATLITDRDGYGEVRLIRGTTVDVAVDGTNFIRRIQIPLIGDGVDLLDPSLSTEDEFGIQEPRLIFANRTS